MSLAAEAGAEADPSLLVGCNDAWAAPGSLKDPLGDPLPCRELYNDCREMIESDNGPVCLGAAADSPQRGWAGEATVAAMRSGATKLSAGRRRPDAAAGVTMLPAVRRRQDAFEANLSTASRSLSCKVMPLRSCIRQERRKEEDCRLNGSPKNVTGYLVIDQAGANKAKAGEGRCVPLVTSSETDKNEGGCHPDSDLHSVNQGPRAA